MTTPLLKLEGLRKAYPGVVANDDVSLEIAEGEVHALLGENGAGKSTLVKMIYGLVKPDTGRMAFQGKTFTPTNPRAARAAGVGMVFQHFSLFDALSVAENIALGMDKPPAMRDLSRRIREVSETYGLPLAPDRIVGDLSAGERQRVEIIRCLLGNPKLLIMDEPTSVLTPQEVDVLFTTLRQLSAEGTAILYISHKLEEIRALCDAATILRGGKVVGECVPEETSAKEMAELMVGKDLVVPERTPGEMSTVVLQAKDLSVPATSQFGVSLKELRFTVQAGEILGIGGVAGNGQDELLGVLSGELECPGYQLYYKEEDLAGMDITKRRGIGILGAPEERLGHAAAPDMSLTENAMLTGAVRQGLVKRGMLNWRKARNFAEEIIAKFDVRTPGPGNAARSLSGGNLQKFVIGREVLQKPDLLVVNQPTWGVDAAAAASVRQALMDLAAGGAAVVVISQDLDELMEISDRFAALNEGRLSAPRATQGLDIEQIGLMMGGADALDAEEKEAEEPAVEEPAAEETSAVDTPDAAPEVAEDAAAPQAPPAEQATEAPQTPEAPAAKTAAPAAPKKQAAPSISIDSAPPAMPEAPQQPTIKMDSPKPPPQQPKSRSINIDSGSPSTGSLGTPGGTGSLVINSGATGPSIEKEPASKMTFSTGRKKTTTDTPAKPAKDEDKDT